MPKVHIYTVALIVSLLLALCCCRSGTRSGLGIVRCASQRLAMEFLDNAMAVRSFLARLDLFPARGRYNRQCPLPGMALTLRLLFRHTDLFVEHSRPTRPETAENHWKPEAQVGRRNPASRNDRKRYCYHDHVAAV
jgi:hypothetical protein